jgi:hypothetical protein
VGGVCRCSRGSVPDSFLSLCAVALAALLVAPVSAQRAVLTVGGANPTHADVPAAVAAAAPGDVVHVRPGTWTGFTTNKPLRLWLDFTAQTGSIVPPPGANHTIEVNGLPVGAPFVLVGRGSRIAPGALAAVRVANALAPVVLAGLSLTSGSGAGALDVQNASTVLIERSTLSGAFGLQVQDAIVVADEVACTGLAWPAVIASRATLELTLGSYTGTRHPAIRLHDSAARLGSDGSTALRVTGAPAGPVAAFEAVRTDVQWAQNRFVLTPANGSPAFVQVGGQTIVDDVPALRAAGAPPGGNVSLRLQRGTASVGIVVLGELTLSHNALGFRGLYWNEQRPALVLTAGTVDAVGLSFATAIPNVPWLLGEQFCLQGLVLPTGARALRSNPATWTYL